MTPALRYEINYVYKSFYNKSPLMTPNAPNDLSCKLHLMLDVRQGLKLNAQALGKGSVRSRNWISLFAKNLNALKTITVKVEAN
jgi:hypothetical protein